MINEKTLAMTKKGVVLINTSRGALIDTSALIQYVASMQFYISMLTARQCAEIWTFGRRGPGRVREGERILFW